MPQGRAVACRQPEELLSRQEGSLLPGDVVLIKGSRAMAMERLVHAFQAREAHCAA
jgi:UDP-N-acetylmuramyl pentapeptide synthase